jgi:hypothetical protein
MNTYQLSELNKVITKSVKISHIVKMPKGFRVFHETTEAYLATYIKEASVDVHVGEVKDINTDDEKDAAQAGYEAHCDTVMSFDELYQWEIDEGHR